RQTLAEEVDIPKEEGPVFPDGPANRETELVLLEWGNFIRGPVEEIFRIQGRIAQEFVSRAGNFIGTWLGYDIDLPAWVAALLGGVQVGLDLEFLDGLDRGPDDQGQGQPVIVVDAIVQVVVGVFAVAIDKNLAPGTLIVGTRAAHDRPARAIPSARNPRRQDGELNKGAPAQRQVLD